MAGVSRSRPQTLPRFRLARSRQQRCPIVGRIALVGHLAELPIDVRLRSIGAQRCLVVHPGEDDDLRAGAVAEEQPESPAAELCTEPVLAVVAQRAALPIFRTSGMQNNLEHELAWPEVAGRY